jgi:hypothetical protein
MPQDIGDTEAQLALNSIEERRRQVIAEIDMPRLMAAVRRRLEHRVVG